MFNMTKLILASGSTGRKSLLESLHLKFEVVESNVDEEKLQSKDPVEMATLRANAKAESVLLSVFGSQFSDKSLPVVGQSVLKTGKLKTDKLISENRKQKTDNQKTKTKFIKKKVRSQNYLANVSLVDKTKLYPLDSFEI